MKKSVFYGLWGLISVLQVGLLVGMGVLSKLAKKKAGVNHHVAFRKRQYQTLLFTPQKVLLMQIVLAVLVVILVLLLIRCWQKEQRLGVVLYIETLLICIALFSALTLPVIRAVQIYPYLILGITIILLLSLLNVFLMRITRLQS